ncbi:MAG: hypothetical protein AAGD35_02575 [Actinomycetota bacterium]
MGALTTRRGHKNWLIVSAVVVASFGPVFALSSAESTSGLSRWTLELLNGPGGGPESFADGTTRFMSALAGGFLLGWGVMVFAIRAWVYDAAPRGGAALRPRRFLLVVRARQPRLRRLRSSVERGVQHADPAARRWPDVDARPGGSGVTPKASGD